MSVASPAHADDVRQGQWYLGPLGITKAHTITDGHGVRVAVVDSGVDGSVPDLRGSVVAGKDFSGEGSPNGQKPVNGADHGTNVASLLAARGHGTGDGVIGSAPGAAIVSASINNIASNNIRQLIAAVRWAADQNVKVINMSVGGGRTDPEVAAYKYAESKDIVIVAASGNDGATTGGAPCGLPGVVCVGGIDKNLKHDPEANGDAQLAVVGPYATVASADKTPSPRAGLPVVEPATAPNTYAGQSGTSLAAPVVAGVVALIRAKYPQMNAANVVNRLLKTATPAADNTPNPTYGYGIVNAEKALTASIPTVQTNPLGSLVAETTRGTPTSGTRTSNTSDAASSSSAPPIGQAADSGGSNTGLIVGIAIAVVVIAALFVYALARRRRTRVAHKV